MIHSAILCLGSNVEPRRERIDSALRLLEDFVKIECTSDVAESDDITGAGEPYLNMAVKCSAALDKLEFQRKIAGAERAGGRIAGLHGVVHIDIDLVIWDDEVVSPADLFSPYFPPLHRQLCQSPG